MKSFQKIGLGGGCHWCTEAVFQSLKGILKVEQGYIRSHGEHNDFSEAVLIYFDPEQILLKDLIEIHLYTHKSTSNHSFREKYRSAIYYLEESKKQTIKNILNQLQEEFDHQLVTKTLKFQEFQSSRTALLDYYINDPERPFCKKHISPKLDFLKEKYAKVAR